MSQDLEQKMKADLDGNFYSVADDGGVICKPVRLDYIPDYSRPRGMSVVFREDYLRRPWPVEQLRWLLDNYKTKTVSECADYLGVKYHRVYDRVAKLRREERLARKNA